MNNQYPAVTPAKKSTYLDLGAKAGSLGFAGANIAYRLLGKGDLRFATPGGFLQSTAASAALGGLLGAIGGAHVTKNASATNVLAVKETEDIMNQELMRACEMAKLAADMSLPLEKKPAPEAGSQPVQGMTDNSTFSPTSVGASTYAGAVDAAALAKARAAAAMAMSKQADAHTDKIVDEVYAQMSGKDGKPDKGRLAEFRDTLNARLASGKKYVNDKYTAGKKAVGEYSGKAREYATKGYGAAKEHVGRGTKAVGDFAAKNPKLVKGVGYGTAGAALAGAGYAGYRHYKEKNASIEAAYEDYLDKLASIEEYGVTPDEAYMAAEAAVELYNDCLEKMAYAEELFNDADNYFLALEEAEEFEKQAAEYVPIASSTLGALAGATAGYVAGAKFPAMRNGVAMAGAATVGAGVGSALGQFAGNLR